MKNVTLILGLIVMLAAACSSVKVTTDYEKTTDFTVYKTYSLMPWDSTENPILTSLRKNRLEEALKVEMDARGYEYVESGGDLDAHIYVVLERKTATTAYTSYYGGGYGGRYGYRRGGWGWGGGASTTTYSEDDYVDGTLVINLFDTDKKELVWQSVGAGTLKSSQEKREKNLPKVMEKIFWKYPVKKQ